MSILILFITFLVTGIFIINSWSLWDMLGVLGIFYVLLTVLYIAIVKADGYGACVNEIVIVGRLLAPQKIYCDGKILKDS